MSGRAPRRPPQRRGAFAAPGLVCLGLVLGSATLLRAQPAPSGEETAEDFDWAHLCEPVQRAMAERAAARRAAAAAEAPRGAERDGGERSAAGPLLTLVAPVQTPQALAPVAEALEAGLLAGLAALPWDLLHPLPRLGGSEPLGSDCPSEPRPRLRCLGEQARAAGMDMVLQSGVLQRDGVHWLDLRLLHTGTAAVVRETLFPLPEELDAPGAEAAARAAASSLVQDLPATGPGETAPGADPRAGQFELFTLLLGMIHIPGGKCFIGSVEAAGESDERPRRALDLAPYWIDRREVTVAAYRRCVLRGACTEPKPPLDTQQAARCSSEVEGQDEHPVTCVNWQQARAFCREQGKTLPSEARWEFAARGPEERPFPWVAGWPPPDQGPNLADRSFGALFPEWPTVPDYDDGWPVTAPAGSRAADRSPFGALDLGGNVAEWTLDCYEAGGYARLSGPAPFLSGEGSCERRVLRGGSWFQDHPNILRAANRRPAPELGTSPQAGFRCVALHRAPQPGLLAPKAPLGP